MVKIIKNKIPKKFKTDIKYIVSLNEIKLKYLDIVYFNSSLQYLENYELIIKKVSKYKPRYILVSYTPLHFENKNYSILVSEFSCSDLNSAGSTERYGSRPFDGSNFRSSLYIIDMQVEIYKKIKDELRLYNVVDFQRTVFVNDEFI